MPTAYPESLIVPHPDASTTSGLRLFASLVSGRFSQRDYLDERKNRIKFALRSLLSLPWTMRWLAFIQQQPRLLAYARHAPRIAAKLHRPYLHSKLGMAGKLANLKAHYGTMLALPENAREALLSETGLLLATVTGKHDAPFYCLLTHQHYFDKEGELTLRWLGADQVALASLTFTVCDIDGKRSIVIGGLQGPHREYGAEGIKSATKACHGLFPKRLTVEALQHVAAALHVTHLLAVGKQHHIYSSWRYQRDFLADYDSFWESLGANRDNDVYYVLPMPLPRKPLASVASNKRSEYQRRYALMDSLAEQIATTLGV